MKNRKGLIGLLVAVVLIIAVTFVFRNRGIEATNNGSHSSSNSSGGSQDVQTITIATQQNYYPYNYVDDEGHSAGYEVDVMKAVDEKLPQYEFEFVPTSNDDIFVGLDSGRYDASTKGIWWTEDRAEKYILPENYHGASIIGLTTRAEDADEVQSLEDFASQDGKLVPISPQNAQYNVIEEYNQEKPDNQIELTPADQFDLSDAYAWVLEGRYDGYLNIEISHQESVEDPDGAYYEYADQLSYIPYKGIPIYAIFARNDENQALAEAYDEVIVELQEDGTLAEFSNKWFEKNVFDFITE